MKHEIHRVAGFSKVRDFTLRVELDPEAHTLVWPNGADFDPAMLPDWPEVRSELSDLAATRRSVLV